MKSKPNIMSYRHTFQHNLLLANGTVSKVPALLLWFGCGRQQKRHVATSTTAGVWRRM